MIKKFFLPLTLVLALVVMAYGMSGTGAWFTDTATSTNGTIKSGTLRINDGALSTATLGTVENMAPGDVTGDIVIKILNDGNIDLAWFGNLEFEGGAKLREVMYIDYAQMEFLTPTGDTWESADNFIQDGKGAGLYPTYYNSLIDPTYGVIMLNAFDASNPMGAAPNEFKGALKPDYAYRLTLKLGMVEEAGNEYQNLGPMTVKYTVNATQVNQGAIEALGMYFETWFGNQIANQTEP